ncbi:MAG TPA: NosD domain-containing protein [Gemmatimonadales bacterium]|nr:NosD domain-containing protein [Gemmatimonadales bacterium]
MLKIASLVSGLLAVPLLIAPMAPCITLPRAGTRVSGDVKVCPGTYRISDPREQGVLIVAGSDTRLDLSGVTIESGDSIPARFVGVGVLVQGSDRVSISGGRIRGYRWGIRVEGGAGHRIEDLALSGSRAQTLRSTDLKYDEGDWLDIFHPESTLAYGGGLVLLDADRATVQRVRANGAQNGIALIRTTRSWLSENDVSGNSGWGFSLWASSGNTLQRNQAHHNVRCEAPTWSRGCDSAGILLRDRSDSNLVADNDLRHSGDGFFLSGHRGAVRPSNGNLVVRNDASGSPHNAFEATFSTGNSFVDNRADSSAYGFWLGYSTATLVRGSTIVGSKQEAIAIEHGSDNELSRNVIVGGKRGIHLFAPAANEDPSRSTVVSRNTVSGTEQGVVLERTTGATVVGNVFDEVGDALVADGMAVDARVTANIFLAVRGWIIDAPDINAGGNFWATADERAAQAHVRGRVTVLPWRPASDAGY